MLRGLGEDHKPKTLEAYHGVTTLAVNVPRNLLALASPTGVHLLSLKTGAGARTISTANTVTALSFTPDGSTLSYGHDTGAIVTIDVATGKSTTLAATHNVAVRSILHFDKCMDSIAGYEDGTICFWDKGSRECHRILTAHAMPVTLLSPTVDGKIFLSGAKDRLIKIWNRKSGRQITSMEPHEDTVNAAMMLRDNAHFLSASDDDLIKVWDIESGRCLHTLDGGGDGIRSLAMGAKPHIFLAGRNDGAIIVWMVIYDLEFP